MATNKQVASPSRERSGLRGPRDAVELVVSRINGEHAEVGSASVLTHGRQLRLAATFC
jgi:hypothetical protein